MKRILKAVVFLSAIGLVFPGANCIEASPHPDVMLMNHHGNPIDTGGTVPYSPKQTCGGCHDYDMITNAYHFQQGRTDADGRIIVSDGFDSKKPWNLSDGMYGKW